MTSTLRLNHNSETYLSLNLLQPTLVCGCSNRWRELATNVSLIFRVDERWLCSRYTVFWCRWVDWLKWLSRIGFKHPRLSTPMRKILHSSVITPTSNVTHYYEDNNSTPYALRLQRLRIFVYIWVDVGFKCAMCVCKLCSAEKMRYNILCLTRRVKMKFFCTFVVHTALDSSCQHPLLARFKIW